MSKATVLSLLLSVAVSVVLSAGVCWAGSGETEICRVIRDREECVRFPIDCKTSAIERVPGKPERSCAGKSDICEAIRDRAVRAAKQMEALPASQKTVDALGMTCNGFRLSSPSRSYSACIGEQREGAKILFDLFIHSKDLCGG